MSEKEASPIRSIYDLDEGHTPILALESLIEDQKCTIMRNQTTLGKEPAQIKYEPGALILGHRLGNVPLLLKIYRFTFV